MREPNLAEEAEKKKTGTMCCGTVGFRMPIYALFPMENEHGRREIGYIPTCAKCRKQTGSAKFDNAPSDFKTSSWLTMMRVHRDPPYYFTKDSTGEWIPEGSGHRKFTPGPQDLAANQGFEESFE